MDCKVRVYYCLQISCSLPPPLLLPFLTESLLGKLYKVHTLKMFTAYKKKKKSDIYWMFIYYSVIPYLYSEILLNVFFI